MFLLVLVVGLLVFIVLKLTMMSSEITWLRKYILRLLTKEVEAQQSDRDVARREEANTVPVHPPPIARPDVFIDPVDFEGLGETMVGAILEARQGMQEGATNGAVIEEVLSEDGSDRDESEREVELEHSDSDDEETPP